MVSDAVWVGRVDEKRRRDWIGSDSQVLFVREKRRDEGRVGEYAQVEGVSLPVAALGPESVPAGVFLQLACV